MGLTGPEAFLTMHSVPWVCQHLCVKSSSQQKFQTIETMMT